MTHTAPAIVIMGISGCGKSTLGQRLSQATGYEFIEGDKLHLPEHIAKMAGGMALTDEDRWPWLERIAGALTMPHNRNGQGEAGLIVSCSALKRSYRDLLRSRVGDSLLFIFPIVSMDVLRFRLRNRPDHYMPLSLLDSQMATLEPPMPDERILTIDGEASPDQSVDLIIGFLSSRNDIYACVSPG